MIAISIFVQNFWNTTNLNNSNVKLHTPIAFSLIIQTRMMAALTLEGLITEYYF